MKKVFVAGNRLVEEDSLALKVAKELEGKIEGIEFEEIESVSELNEIPQKLWLLDVAKGIEKVELIDDLNRLEQVKLVSLHDLDLATELLLLKKIGKLEKVRIVAIPAGMEVGKAAKETKKIIKMRL